MQAVSVLGNDRCSPPAKEPKSERPKTKPKMLSCRQSASGPAGFQSSVLLKAGLGFGCLFIKNNQKPSLPPLRRSLHPNQQSVEKRAALLLRDPLDLRVAETRI